MATIDIKVPDIGDFKDVPVIELMVKPGDKVAKEQSLVTLESDKATMEVPSSHSGTVKELRVKVGDKVSQGTVIAVLDVAEAATAPAKPAPATAAGSPAPKAASAPQPARVPAATPRPSARPTSARRWCWWSATPRWAACA
jgi:pyruvate/2-oxoglutarate dehydrogenase complex dihydrolipoamide acyltransferase (E2) component